jgi:hypothetical protein
MEAWHRRIVQELALTIQDEQGNESVFQRNRVRNLPRQILIQKASYRPARLQAHLPSWLHLGMDLHED